MHCCAGRCYLHLTTVLLCIWLACLHVAMYVLPPEPRMHPLGLPLWMRRCCQWSAHSDKPTLEHVRTVRSSRQSFSGRGGDNLSLSSIFRARCLCCHGRVRRRFGLVCIFMTCLFFKNMAQLSEINLIFSHVISYKSTITEKKYAIAHTYTILTCMNRNTNVLVQGPTCK